MIAASISFHAPAPFHVPLSSTSSACCFSALASPFAVRPFRASVSVGCPRPYIVTQPRGPGRSWQHCYWRTGTRATWKSGPPPEPQRRSDGKKGADRHHRRTFGTPLAVDSLTPFRHHILGHPTARQATALTVERLADTSSRSPSLRCSETTQPRPPVAASRTHTASRRRQKADAGSNGTWSGPPTRDRIPTRPSTAHHLSQTNGCRSLRRLPIAASLHGISCWENRMV